MIITAVVVLATLLAIVLYMLARAVNEILFLNDDLRQALDTDHTECMTLVMKAVGDEFAAQIFEVAADDWESVEEQDRKKVLYRAHYKGEDGPSLTAIWLRHRAAKLRIMADTDWTVGADK